MRFCPPVLDIALHTAGQTTAEPVLGSAVVCLSGAACLRGGAPWPGTGGRRTAKPVTSRQKQRSARKEGADRSGMRRQRGTGGGRAGQGESLRGNGEGWGEQDRSAIPDLPAGRADFSGRERPRRFRAEPCGFCTNDTQRQEKVLHLKNKTTGNDRK